MQTALVAPTPPECSTTSWASDKGGDGQDEGLAQFPVLQVYLDTLVKSFHFSGYFIGYFKSE